MESEVTETTNHASDRKSEDLRLWEHARCDLKLARAKVDVSQSNYRVQAGTCLHRMDDFFSLSSLFLHKAFSRAYAWRESRSELDKRGREYVGSLGIAIGFARMVVDSGERCGKDLTEVQGLITKFDAEVALVEFTLKFHD